MFPMNILASFPELAQLRDDNADMEITVGRNCMLAMVQLLLGSWPFDETWYLATYPEISDEIRKGRFISARQHFLRYGFFQGRLPCKPKVDAEWYTKSYPDVARGIASRRIRSAEDHYIVFGFREGRMPNKEMADYVNSLGLPGLTDVDAEWYKWQYTDVANAMAAGRIRSAEEHYAVFGFREGRMPNKVVAAQFLAQAANGSLR